jgi:hypothetical protein
MRRRVPEARAADLIGGEYNRLVEIEASAPEFAYGPVT